MVIDGPDEDNSSTWRPGGAGDERPIPVRDDQPRRATHRCRVMSAPAERHAPHHGHLGSVPGCRPYAGQRPASGCHQEQADRAVAQQDRQRRGTDPAIACSRPTGPKASVPASCLRTSLTVLISPWWDASAGVKMGPGSPRRRCVLGLETVLQSGAGARPEGSRSVATSTPIRISVP